VQRAGRPAGGKQQLAVADFLAVAGGDTVFLDVQVGHRLAGAHLGTGVGGGVQPVVGVLEVGIGPQFLGQRRPRVGRVRVVTDQADTAGAVEFFDAAGSRVGGHSGADDQVVEGRHASPPQIVATEPASTR